MRINGVAPGQWVSCVCVWGWVGLSAVGGSTQLSQHAAHTPRHNDTSGPIWTPLIAQSFPGEPEKEAGHAHAIASFGANYPIGRAGQPAEVAPAFVYLADVRASSFVAGEILAVTGGQPTA